MKKSDIKTYYVTDAIYIDHELTTIAKRNVDRTRNYWHFNKPQKYGMGLGSYGVQRWHNRNH